MAEEFPDKLLLVKEVAQVLRSSQSNVYNLIDSGELRSYRVGSGRAGIRVSWEHIALFLASREQGVEEAFDPPPPPPKLNLQNLSLD